MSFVSLICGILTLVASWMIFKKMGHQGWEGIVPLLQHLRSLPGAVRKRLEIPAAPDPPLQHLFHHQNADRSGQGL